jgi:hypothetical protein
MRVTPNRWLVPRSVAAAVVLLIAGALTAQASSHREAPFITELPKVDGTDFYMFRSYEPGRDGFVTLIADYLPLQDPYGGPNYFFLDPDARYEIHIDNDGDAKPDVTFQFRFQNALINDNGRQGKHLDIGGVPVAIPLVAFGPISAGDSSKLNLIETYTVRVLRSNRRGRAGHAEDVTNNADGGSNIFIKPVDNIGNKSIPNYPAYAAAHVYADITVPGCGTGAKLFVGQRKDPFVVNLGETFDRINLNPLGPPDAEADDLADKNVTSLVLEVPISCLTEGSEPVIGGWTTASLPRGRALTANLKRLDFDEPAKERGTLIQVSRLGSPLVNELIIGLKDKDRFNASEPSADAQFAIYVTNPALPALIESLFPSAPAPTLFPRADLVAAFLTGINTPATGNVNQPANVVPAEMLRLNTGVAPTPRDMQSNLGVIGGDNAGFPNGRRPGDDVVDIELRVAMGKLIALGLFGTPGQAPAGNAPLTDGALVNAGVFPAAFPYVNDPLPGSPNGTP